jgi:hypothetical protein
MRRFWIVGVVLSLGAVIMPATTSGARSLRAPHASHSHAVSVRVATSHSRWTFDTSGHTPSPVTGNASVTATPSTDLLDGQQITVTASGLTKKTLYAVFECQAGATDPTGCGTFDLGLGKTDATGSFTTSFTVSRMIATDSTPIDCAVASCVLAVGAKNGSLPAETPLSFTDVPVVTPTLTADPKTGLLDQQMITVTGSDFGPNAFVGLVECIAPAAETDCDIDTLEPAVVGPDGSFSTTYLVTRIISNGEASVDCAQPAACVLSTLTDDGDGLAASVSISFADVVIVPPVMTVTPSTGLDDGQTVVVTGKAFRHHDDIGLTECAAGSTDGSECVLQDGLGNASEVSTGRHGKFTATFSVSRVLTLFGETVDCAQAPGCVLGAVDLDTESGTVVSSTPISFDPSVKPLPPLNLVVKVSSTGQVMSGSAKKGNEAEIKATITCDRSSPTSVNYELQVTEPVSGSQDGAFGGVLGETTCQRGGTKVNLGVSSGPARLGPSFIPGLAGVLFEAAAVSGSSGGSTTTNASVTLKAAKS